MIGNQQAWPYQEARADRITADQDAAHRLGRPHTPLQEIDLVDIVLPGDRFQRPAFRHGHVSRADDSGPSGGHHHPMLLHFRELCIARRSAAAISFRRLPRQFAPHGFHAFDIVHRASCRI